MNPRMVAAPTIFHVTNHKAGSQWVAEILKYSAPERFVTPQVGVRHFLERQLMLGRIYPTLYVTRQEFVGTLLGRRIPRSYHRPNRVKNYLAGMLNRYHFHFRKNPYKIVVVIRDLRDILVSMYFSLMISHPEVTNLITYQRKALNAMEKEDGLLYLMDAKLSLESQIQRSWWADQKDGAILWIRYEDLLADEKSCFMKIIEHCQIDVPVQQLNDIVSNNSFDNVTGRKRGQERIDAHLRKGVSGDWANHFTDRVKSGFKQRYGDLLVMTGYASDLVW